MALTERTYKWDENFVYSTDDTKKPLPDLLSSRGICTLEIVFRSKGCRCYAIDDSYSHDEERSLVEANAYLANGDYLQLSDDEQKAAWELYEAEVNQQPLGP